jgi:hypothetical protein
VAPRRGAVRFASVVGEAVLELQIVRRVDGPHPPPASRLVTLGTGHEIGDRPSNGQVVVEDRRRVGRRAPPPLELIKELSCPTPWTRSRSIGRIGNEVDILDARGMRTPRLITLCP